ncbi:MAG: RNA polymerase sigma factor [Parabacteroides sp.]
METREKQEWQWIARIVAGDMQSFSCLVARYERMAFTLALRVLGNREDAEEAAQDAFLRAYRALPDFRFDCKFSTWFYRIVYRTALTALQGRQETITYEEELSPDLSVSEADAAASLLERKERHAIVSQVLKTLPPDDSLLLTLYYLEECSVEEIRQITDWSTTNIKTKLFRARKHFYDKIKNYEL